VRLAAGEGAVWITQAGGVRPPARPRPSTVLAVVPESLRPAGPPVRVGDRPGGIAVGEGFVWVVSPDDGTIAQIDPQR
jgi:DNA-binding beta-propeller fold protein YncE